MEFNAEHFQQMKNSTEYFWGEVNSFPLYYLFLLEREALFHMSPYSEEKKGFFSGEAERDEKRYLKQWQFKKEENEDGIDLAGMEKELRDQFVNDIFRRFFIRKLEKEFMMDAPEAQLKKAQDSADSGGDILSLLRN